MKPSRPATSCRGSVEGPSFGALFASNGSQTELLGITQQLVGQPPYDKFQVCLLRLGRTGASVQPTLQNQVAKIGNCVASFFAMQGCFLESTSSLTRTAMPWLIEINPRITASAEVLRTGWLFRKCGQGTSRRIQRNTTIANGNERAAIVGKAIVFSNQHRAFSVSEPVV